MQSFEAALNYGVSGLEMDVHMSSDGVIVVSHDPSGRRMCNVSQAISQTPYEELARWDAGWGFTDESGKRIFAGKGFRLPRFEDVLSAFPSMKINVDLKQWMPSMVRRIMKIVSAAKSEERVTLASFHQTTLLHLRASGYPGATALGSAEVLSALLVPPLLLRALPLRGSRAQIPTHHGRIRFDTRDRIERLQRTGVHVDFWTINDPQEASALLAKGADGIMTDDPKALASLFR